MVMPSRSNPHRMPLPEPPVAPPPEKRPPDAPDATPAASPDVDRAARHRPPAESLAEAAATRGEDGGWIEGPPARPDIFQDNGFLQNPDDRTDRTPMPTRPCTLSDHAKYQVWSVASYGAQLLPILDDGVAAYQRFVFGRGAPGEVDYEAFLRDDPAGPVVAANLVLEGQRAAEEHYRALVAAHPEAAGETLRFSLSGPAHRLLYRHPVRPAPATENWQKAIGEHAVWSSIEVEVSPPLNAGEAPRFAMKLVIHAEDRYNFNPGQHDNRSGIPDAENGPFEECGLAQQYTNHGTAERSVEWRAGRRPQKLARYVGGDVLR
jgi:hypothetical protein